MEIAVVSSYEKLSDSKKQTSFLDILPVNNDVAMDYNGQAKEGVW